VKKVSFFVLILLFITSSNFAQAQKFQVYIFSGVNHVLEYGSEDDYVMGENDFPVTPAHTPANFGVAFAYFFTKDMGIELDGRYTLSSTATLQDPSDQDTVEISTLKHFAVTLNFIYQFSKGKDEAYTTKYGYPFTYEVPEKAFDFLTNIGAGIQYFINLNFGARLDFRYVLIFDDPNNVISFNVVVGGFLRF
jgi:hypothetical protein